MTTLAKLKAEAEAKAKSKAFGATATTAKKNATDGKTLSEFYKALANHDRSALKAMEGDIVKGYKAKAEDEGATPEAVEAINQNVANGADGGFLVPTELATAVREKLTYLSPLRSIATIISNLPADLKIPFETEMPTAYWVGEGEAPTASKSQFELKGLKAHKIGGFGKFTHESLVDTAISPDLQNFVADRFALSIALKENEAYVNGDGTDKPYGFRSSAITPKTGAVATTGKLTYADLVKAYFGVHVSVRGRGVWVMPTSAIAQVVGMVDSQNRPLYVPAMSENAPATILGRPVYEVPEIPSDLGTGKNQTEIWFGDFKNLIIGDREGMRVQFGTTGTDLESDMISLVLFHRTGALPIYGEAFYKLTGVPSV